jgi:hypothetical protein
MLDLYNQKYDIATLTKYIYAVSLLDILKTQTITEDFAFNYILNKKYQLTEEEENINFTTIFYFQPHLIKSNLFVRCLLNEEKTDEWNEFELCLKNE